MPQEARLGGARDDPTGSRPAAGVRLVEWTGVIAFAATIMFVLGSFQIIEGTLALLDEEYYYASASGLAVQVSYTVWGWLHLIIGTVIVISAVGVFGGRVWGRAVGVLLAFMSAVTNWGFAAANPVWSALMMTLAIVVIWGLVVHGGAIRGS